MSRAAVRARAGVRRLARDDAATLAWMRRIEADWRVDACLARCDGCGLVQVSPGPPCVVCGGWVGVYVERLVWPGV